MSIYVVFKPSAPVALENVVLEYVDTERTPDFSEAEKGVLKAVEAQVEQDVASGKIVNRKNLHLDGFVQDGKKVVIKASYARHASYVMYRNLCGKTAISLQPDFVLLSTIIPTVTNDGWQVFGFRKGAHLAGRYLSPAGFCDFDDAPCPNYFAMHTAEETREETGVIRPGQSFFVGISFDDSDSFLSCAVVHTALVHSRTYVERAWTKSGNKEHDHLIYLRDDPKLTAGFVCKNLAQTVVNPERGIVMDADKVGKGSKVVSYRLIENGIASLILDVYASHRTQAGDDFVGRLKSAGHNVIFGMP